MSTIALLEIPSLFELPILLPPFLLILLLLLLHPPLLLLPPLLRLLLLTLLRLLTLLTLLTCDGASSSFVVSSFPLSLVHISIPLLSLCPFFPVSPSLFRTLRLSSAVQSLAGCVNKACG